MAGKDDNALGQSLQALSARHGTPLDQDAELTGLLTRVGEAEGIPDTLVCALSRVLEFLYREETKAADED